MSPLLLHSNTNQYYINGLCVPTPRFFAYRHAATTFYQLQRGFGGRRQHARIQEILSVLFSPQLILQIFLTSVTKVQGLINHQYLRFIHQRLDTLARKTCEIYSFFPEISSLTSSQCPCSFIMSCNICYSL